MSMLATPRNGGCIIGYGDVVFVYERHDRIKAVTVAKNGELQNRFGVFPHNDWIGKPFGWQAVAKNSTGFVYLLAPTPELWTNALPHRTQILYVADISFVVSYLELRPGSVVLESGTGSGSLTHSLARAVAPNGHVHTFDYHEQRAQAAREDFARNRVDSVVTVKVRDIQGEGFPEDLVGSVDGVFLDLPQPWLALPSVAKSLRGDGVMCSFSPCIEQVQRTCEVLGSGYFNDIRTFEVLLRFYEVRRNNLSKSFEFNEQFGDGASKSPPYKRQRGQKPVGDTVQESENQESESVGNQKAERPAVQTVLARPYPETKGHTGYLTFARRSV